jgi:hypothetical protein
VRAAVRYLRLTRSTRERQLLEVASITVFCPAVVFPAIKPRYASMLKVNIGTKSPASSTRADPRGINPKVGFREGAAAAALLDPDLAPVPSPERDIDPREASAVTERESPRTAIGLIRCH